MLTLFELFCRNKISFFLIIGITIFALSKNLKIEYQFSTVKFGSNRLSSILENTLYMLCSIEIVIIIDSQFILYPFFCSGITKVTINGVNRFVDIFSLLIIIKQFACYISRSFNNNMHIDKSIENLELWFFGQLHIGHRRLV